MLQGCEDLGFSAGVSVLCRTARLNNQFCLFNYGTGLLWGASAAQEDGPENRIWRFNKVDRNETLSFTQV